VNLNATKCVTQVQTQGLLQMAQIGVTLDVKMADEKENQQF
jgi:hypothetical protein